MNQQVEPRGGALSRRDALQEAVTVRRDELRRAVQNLTEVVKGRVGTLKERVDVVKERMDLGRHVHERAWLVVGGAFGIGLLLGVRRMWTPPKRQRVRTRRIVWRKVWR
jgi:hypothetical protein